MITLNLISEEVKKAHARMHINSVIRNNLLLLFIAITLISIMILFGKIYLQEKFIAVVEENTQTTDRIQSLITFEVTVSNDILKSVKTIQDEYIPWQRLLVILSEITPETVVIRQIQITQERGSLNLLGTAQDRDSFLLFKQHIDANPLFTNVESPISNILNKTDINFTLGITLDATLIE